MKYKVSALLIIILSLTLATPTFAQYVGVGTAAIPTRQVMIDKKLLNPQNNQFVDNLNIEQHNFLPNQDIIFRITVTNVVQSELKNVVVTDKLPDLLNFVSTSFGSYDANTRTITLTLDTLKVGESKTFEIKTKVKQEAEILNMVSCQANLSRMTVGNMVDDDTSSFCITKQGLGAMPATGPKETLLLLTLSALLLAIGLLTKKISYLERG